MTCRRTVDGAAGLGPVGVDGDMEDEETLESRYPTRARRAPGEWYRANVAVETGEHPKGSGEHPEPQTYQEAGEFGQPKYYG